MIYPAEADLVPLVAGLVQGLQPYAAANKVSVCFRCDTTALVTEHHPYNLIQSLSQLLCQIINLVPHQSETHVQLYSCQQEQALWLEVENTGVNLLPVNQLGKHCSYTFTTPPLTNGTLFRMTLPTSKNDSLVQVSTEKQAAFNKLPGYSQSTILLLWYKVQVEFSNNGREK